MLSGRIPTMNHAAHNGMHDPLCCATPGTRSLVTGKCSQMRVATAQPTAACEVPPLLRNCFTPSWQHELETVSQASSLFPSNMTCTHACWKHTMPPNHAAHSGMRGPLQHRSHSLNSSIDPVRRRPGSASCLAGGGRPSRREQSQDRTIEFPDTNASIRGAASLLRTLCRAANSTASLPPSATLRRVVLCHASEAETKRVSTPQAASTDLFDLVSKICCDGLCSDLCSLAFVLQQLAPMGSFCHSYDDSWQYSRNSRAWRANVVHSDTRLKQWETEIYLV